MDVCDIEPLSAVLLQKPTHADDRLRVPLEPSEKNNAAAAAAAVRKPRTKEVASRYKSGISSTPSTPRRDPSPPSGRTSAAAVGSLSKRSPSTERRPSTSSGPSAPSRAYRPSSPSSRPSSPSSTSTSSRPTTPAHDAVSDTPGAPRSSFSGRAPDGLWPSMRSLSFQTESKREKIITSSPTDDAKLRESTVPERKRSPLRGRNITDQSDNSRTSEKQHAKVIDQHRWPAMMGGKVSGSAMSRSMDLTDKPNKSALSSVPPTRLSPKRTSLIADADVLSRSMDLTDKIKRFISSTLPSRGTSPRRTATDATNGTTKNIDSADKDNKSVSAAVPSKGVSPRRRLSSDGDKAASKVMDSTDKESRTISLPVSSRGSSPRRSASDANDAKSKSIDLVDGDSKRLSLSVPSRGLSPRRMPASNVTNSLKSMDLTNKDGSKSSLSVQTRGTSPIRRLSFDGTGYTSKSNDLADKGSRPISLSVSSRGVSPRKAPASHGPSAISKSTDFADKDTRPMSLSVSSRGVSPRRRQASDNANAMSRSMDLTDRVKTSLSSTVQSRGVSPRKMPVSGSALKGPVLSSNEVESPRSADGNGRAEEESGSGSSLDVSSQTPVKRLTRTLSSPARGLIRPSSPNKVLSTSSFASRRLQSPSRTRPSTPVSPSSSVNSRSDSVSSGLGYTVNVAKRKQNTGQMEEAHQLRLLYNRDLQWRFINAYTDETLSFQRISAEAILYGVWSTNSQLCDAITLKSTYVQQLSQNVKLGIILKQQADYLDYWAALQTEHDSSLLGATEALRASTLRLPVTAGAKADVFAVKNAVSSAVDIMQAMGSSIGHLLSKLEATHTLVAELSVAAAKETAILDECREHLATVAALQVQDCSLRMQLIQQRLEMDRGH